MADKKTVNVTACPFHSPRCELETCMAPTNAPEDQRTPWVRCKLHTSWIPLADWMRTPQAAVALAPTPSIDDAALCAAFELFYSQPGTLDIINEFRRRIDTDPIFKVVMHPVNQGAEVIKRYMGKHAALLIFLLASIEDYLQATRGPQVSPAFKEALPIRRKLFNACKIVRDSLGIAAELVDDLDSLTPEPHE